MKKELPMSGLCVIEIGHSLAAPYAGMILAGLGARVVKIESPGKGDPARGWGPPFFDDAAIMFHAVNTGKESVQLDLRYPAQADVLRNFILTEGSVVLQNLKLGSLEKYGLGAQQLCAAKPSLIYCNLGAFGATGPLRHKPGYDPLVQAYSGMMKLVGNEGDAASRVPVSVNDMGTGLWAVIGILSAIMEREKTGEGTVVDVSLYETALAWMTVYLSDSLGGANPPGRLGSGNANIAPYQVFVCQDDSILVAAGNDYLFGQLCECLGSPELVQDPRFTSNGGRVTHRKVLIPILAERFRTATATHWLESLEAIGVPCGPLQSISDVLASPQTEALNILQRIPDMDVTTVGLPLSFNGNRPALPSKSPLLGEHTHLLTQNFNFPTRQT